MPKGRYSIMRDTCRRPGKLGLDMMLRTCTVQANLDFESEADMVRKLRVSLALQPLATALFANSPFIEGKPNGYLSYRAQIWTDTDPDRTGTLPFAFEDGMGFERYVDYLLDVPMYFVYRDGHYIDAQRPVVPRFHGGQAAGSAGRDAEHRRLGRSHDHRLSRGAAEELPRDARRRWRPLAPALRAAGAVGRAALRQPGARCRLRSGQGLDRGGARGAAPRRAAPGAGCRFRGRKLRDWSRDVLAIARDGLTRRRKLDRMGGDESHFLNALDRIADSGKTPAQEKLELFHGRWKGSVDPVFGEFAY